MTEEEGITRLHTQNIITTKYSTKQRLLQIKLRKKNNE